MSKKQVFVDTNVILESFRITAGKRYVKSLK